MPKKLFFSINEEKRKKILDVAIEEFTSKPFEQVSVNTIIKKSEISRGSFYTYFDNLENLFNYIFEEVKKERFAYARQILLDVKGDYFRFIKTLFAYDYDIYFSEGRYSLFRNYIHYIHTIKKGTLKNDVISGSIFIFNNKIKSGDIQNINNLDISEDEFFDIIEVVILLMVNTFIKSENEKLSKEQTIKLFNQRIGYLEHGIRRKTS